MATIPSSPPATGRSFWRFWFPLVVPILAALALAAIWAWPETDSYVLANRVFNTLMIASIALLVLFVCRRIDRRRSGWRGAQRPIYRRHDSHSPFSLGKNRG